MTREQAKKILPIIQAYAKGETIEWRHKHSGEKWKRLKKNEEVCLPSDAWEYRIACEEFTTDWHVTEEEIK